MYTPAGITRRELLSAPQRVAEPLFSAMALVVLGGFFVTHQRLETGFFTERFGPVEMLCLYGPLALSLAAPLTRALYGQRNPARPVEVVTHLCAALAGLWLLQVFPFDFTHLADVFPAEFQFLLAWISDGIGKFLLLLQVAVGVLAALFTLVTYAMVAVTRNRGRGKPDAWAT
jgi:hypothetical protein